LILINNQEIEDQAMDQKRAAAKANGAELLDFRDERDSDYDEFENGIASI
jgi:hypothetical protein